MSHYNNIFNKKNVEYSLVNMEDRLPYEKDEKVNLNSNQIIFTSINNVLQRLLDNDLYNEALLRQYIDEGKIAGPIAVDSVDEILNQYDENKKFVLSNENGIQVVHKKLVPLQDTLKGRYLDGKKVNKIAFANDLYAAVADDGYYVSENKVDWTKKIQKNGISFVDICYNKNYLIDNDSILSSFDWILVGNSSRGIELFGHHWTETAGAEWQDFSLDSKLSSLNIPNAVATHAYSFSDDSNFYIGTKNDGLWSIDGRSNHLPRRENGTNNWTINDFVEVTCEDKFKRYFLATNYGLKQSSSTIGFSDLETVNLFPKNTYIYKVLEKDGFVFAATSNGLARIKNNDVVYIYDGLVLDIIEYSNAIYAACGTNGIYRTNDAYSAVIGVGSVTAIRLASFNGDLFLVNASTKDPQLKCIRYGKTTAKTVCRITDKLIDLISTKDGLYIATNKGVKLVTVSDSSVEFEKMDAEHIGTLRFSKNVSDNEVVVQTTNGSIYSVKDISDTPTMLSSEVPFSIVDAIVSKNGYYFLDETGSVYDSDFNANSELTGISKISYFDNGITDGLAFIREGSVYLSTDMLRKISIEQNTFNDLISYKYNLYASSEHKLYGFDYSTFPNIETNSDRNMVELALKDSNGVLAYLSATTNSFNLKTLVSILENYDLSNFSDELTVSIASENIVAADFVGHSYDSVNNRKFALLGNNTSISTYSIVPEIKNGNTYVSSTLEYAGSVSTGIDSLRGFADLGLFNLILDNGTLKYKVPELTKFGISASINSSFIKDNNVLIATDNGIFSVASSYNDDYILRSEYLNGKKINAINSFGDDGIIFCIGKEQISASETQMQILQNNTILNAYDQYGNTNFSKINITDGNIVPYEVKTLSKSELSDGEDSIFYESESQIDVPDDMIISSLYRDNDRLILGTNQGAKILSYSGTSYSISDAQQEYQLSSFEQIISSGSANSIELADNLSICGNIDSYYQINVGGESNIRNFSRRYREINLDSNVYNLYSTEFLSNCPNFELSIGNFGAYLSVQTSANIEDVSAILEISSTDANGAVSTSSIVSAYGDISTTNANSSTTLYFFKENVLDVSNIAAVNLNFYLSTNTSDAETLSVNSMYFADLSSTVYETPKYPTILESGNGFIEREVEVGQGSYFYGYIAQHNDSKDYIYLNNNGVLVAIKKENFKINNIEKNVVYAYIDKINYIQTLTGFVLDDDGNKKPIYGDTYELSGNLSDDFGHSVSGYVLTKTQITIDGEPQYEISVDTKTGTNDHFNDCICFAVGNEDYIEIVSPSTRKNMLFEDALSSNTDGNIRKLASTTSRTYIIDTDDKLYQSNELFFSKFSELTSSVSDIVASTDALYVRFTDGSLKKYVSASPTEIESTGVTDFFVSNNSLYYVKADKLYDEQKHEVNVSSTNGIIGYNSDPEIEVFADKIKYAKNAFNPSRQYETASINGNGNFTSLFQIDSKNVLLATPDKIFRLIYTDDGIENHLIYRSSSQNPIRAVGSIYGEYLILVEGNDLKISNNQIGTAEIGDFTTNSGVANALTSILRMTNWTDNESIAPPLILANNKTYKITNENLFFQKSNPLTSFESDIRRFIDSNSNLYTVVGNSIYKYGEQDPILTANTDLRNAVILADNNVWSISSNNKPIQYLDKTPKGYNSDGNVDDLFRLDQNVYFYKANSPGIYMKDTIISYSSNGSNAITERTKKKNITALFVEDKDHYIFNYLSTVSNAASAYSGNPSDTWLVCADVSLIDSSESFKDLCANVNLEYDSDNGISLIKKYGNYMVFSDRNSGYAYNTKADFGFNVSFEDLKNLNNGYSKLLDFSNNYLAYGNLIASFDDFEQKMIYGTPTGDFSVLANNFRAGTNDIEVLNKVPDFLIGSNFGLKYVYDRLLTRSFYNRSNLDNSPSKNVVLIKTVDAQNCYYIAAQDNELYEITGLKTPKSRKILTLSEDEEITSIFVFQKDEYLIATTKGIYTTEHRFTLQDDLRAITLSSVYSIINEELSKILSNHIRTDHTEDSFITKLNKKADTTLSFVSAADKHVDVLNSEIANGLKIVENDVIDTIERGGEDPTKDTYVKVAVSNWATRSIETNATYSDGGFISQFVDPTSEKTFDISTVPYVVKNWKSGLKEIYIYVPTTATYYLNNPQGISNSKYTYNSIQRKNIPNASVVNTLPSGCTTLRVYLYNSYFGIKTILAAQCCGNSLPLKIYKDNVNADDSWKGFFDTVVQPSVLKTLPMTQDKDVNNVRICTDDQGRIVLDFSIYGSDAQAIRIIAES